MLEFFDPTLIGTLVFFLTIVLPDLPERHPVLGQVLAVTKDSLKGRGGSAQ